MLGVDSRAPLAKVTRRSGLAALLVAPVVLGTVLLSEARESPAERLVTPPPVAAMALAAPQVDLEQSIPARNYVVSQQVTEPVLQAEAAPAALSVVVEVTPGDTLMALLSREGIGRRDAHDAVAALEEVFSPRDLRPGQQIRLSFSPGEDLLAAAGEEEAPLELVSLGLQPAVDQVVQVVRTDGGFAASTAERPLKMDLRGQSGIIDGSLFASAQEAGVPVSSLIALIRIFSYDVDFQREIQPGDAFEVVYEAYYDESGKLQKTGDILYASLVLSGKPISLYSFTPSSGFHDYFDATGQSVRKALMKTPIDGARISSNFGMRKHPILGYSKLHKGVDFAAPSGTPIYAAGDGVLEVAGWNGGYGKYIRIKHNGTYKTAYAHMSKLAKGMAKGTRVAQGDIIGYVGTTGQSTGPHLHYEVLIDGKQTNPLDIKIPAGEKLAGADLEAFKAAMAEIDRLRGTLTGPALVAEKAAAEQ